MVYMKKKQKAQTADRNKRYVYSLVATSVAFCFTWAKVWNKTNLFFFGLFLFYIYFRPISHVRAVVRRLQATELNWTEISVQLHGRTLQRVLQRTNWQFSLFQFSSV